MRIAVACIVLLGAGAIVFFGNQASKPWAQLWDGLGVALLTTALVGLVYEVWLHATSVSEVLDMVGLSQEMTRGGILEISKFTEIDWRAFFDHGGDIDIFVTYGRTYAGQHSDEIARIAASGRKLRITLLDPDAPAELLSVYAQSFEIDVAELKKRINEVIGMWQAAAAKAGGQGTANLTLERIRTVLPFTFYRSGDFMWVVPGVAQRGRVGSELPAILCRRRGTDYGLFDWIMKDVGACRNQKLIV